MLREVIRSHQALRCSSLESSTCAGPSSARRQLSTSSVAQAKPRRERRQNDPFALRNMGKFQYDDVPTLGHNVLQRQRELLKYARLVEWELPKLEGKTDVGVLLYLSLIAFPAALRRPYIPPSNEDVLHFRSIHYQGEPHPVTRKSVVTVSVKTLFESGLLTSPAARRKFLLLAGTHWNPLKDYTDGSGKENNKYQSLDIVNDPLSVEKQALDEGLGSVKISCERFPDQRQNFKWCSDTMDKLIEEANTNPGEMQDIPLDLRPARARQIKRNSLERKGGASLADFPVEWLPQRESE